MSPVSETLLAEVLDQELALASQLADLLAAERAALTGASPDAVAERAADKIRLFERFEELERRRRALCADANLDAGAPLDGAQVPAALARRWRSLIEAAAACRAANDVNGHIVHLRRNQVRELIDALRGGAPVTYGPQGRIGAAALRALAQA